MFVRNPFRLLVVILAGTLALAIPVETRVDQGDIVYADSAKFHPPELPVSISQRTCSLDWKKNLNRVVLILPLPSIPESRKNMSRLH